MDGKSLDLLINRLADYVAKAKYSGHRPELLNHIPNLPITP